MVSDGRRVGRELLVCGLMKAALILYVRAMLAGCLELTRDISPF